MGARALVCANLIETENHALPGSRQALGFGRVNLLKKVKVDGQWKFCPAVVDPGRRLSDKVRVEGNIAIAIIRA